MGIRNVEIIKSAKKLQEGLKAIQKSFDKFYNKYEEIGKNIEKAQDAYRVGDAHIGHYKRHLDDTLRLEGFHEDTHSLPGSEEEDK